jgi:hypothetical protein
MASLLWDADRVTRWPTRNFRPDPDDYDPVKAAADDAGWNMNLLLQAFLRAVKRDPKAMLELLDGDLRDIASETPPRGRPKKKPPAAEANEG